VVFVPLHFLVNDNLGLILLGVDLKFVVVGRFPRRRSRRNPDWLAGSQQTVHARGGDAYSLLPPGHLESVELRPVQQLAEDIWDLGFHDAGTVVLNRHDVPVPAIAVLDRRSDSCDLRQYACLFACVQSIIDSFFYSC